MFTARKTVLFLLLSFAPSAGWRVAQGAPVQLVIQSEKTPVAAPSDLAQVNLLLQSGDWGEGSPENRGAVLVSAATEMLANFPNRRLKPIIVRYDKEGPITLYQRGANGEFIVELNSKDRYWSQLAFQFAHEFCHVLANYDQQRTEQNPNQWFEESVCEMASLYTLRRMAKSWQVAPPYSNWRDYSASLQKYADDRMNDQLHQLPPNQSFGTWFNINHSTMRANPILREKNEVVAIALLPMFEQDPSLWSALGTLNLGKIDRTKSFKQYLQDWYENSPLKHQAAVKKIAMRFEVVVGEGR